MKITINGTEKEVEFKKVYTRAVDRWFNTLLFGDTKANTSAKDIDIELKNMGEANDFLVREMTNLTQEEINDMASSDYDKILARVGEIKNGS